MVTRYLISRAENLDMITILLLCGGGLGLVYGIDFLYQKVKSKK